MSKRIIESMINFKYFQKLHKTHKETPSRFFARYFLSKISKKTEFKKPNVNFIFKFSDYKSLNLETSQDIFIKELKKNETEEINSKKDINTFYCDRETRDRNVNIMMNILLRRKKCKRYFKYNDINEKLIKILLTHSYHANFKKDSIIFKEGSKQIAFYFLIRGKIALKTLNPELMKKNMIKNRLKLENIYSQIKTEEKFNLQNKNDDNISLDNFVSTTNLDPFMQFENDNRKKNRPRITSSKELNKSPDVRRSKHRVATLKEEAYASPRKIIQNRILVENFNKLQNELSFTVKTYTENDFFCDWECIYDKPHTETAYAEEDIDLLILPKKHFDKYFANHLIKVDNQRKIFLTKRIEFLHINNVINLKPEFYDKGKVIYTQFDPANEFFIVYKGRGALMDLNENYVYKKRSDVVYNSDNLKKICNMGEGCVVGLESFNDGMKKYDNNFVIDEDNTVIYRIKMHAITLDNYLKKKNKIKLKKQLNEMYLNQIEMLPKLINHKRLTNEEKKYKKTEEKINNVFYDAKKYFWKKIVNEKRINTVYGNLNQITEIKKQISEKTDKSFHLNKFSKSVKKIPFIDFENNDSNSNNISSSFKRKSRFHFLTTITNKRVKIPGSRISDFGLMPLQNNLKNTLESLKSGKKENKFENNNKDNKRPPSPKRFSLFNFQFKNNLFKSFQQNKKNKDGNNKEKEKEENFYDFYGDTNNEFFKTSKKFKYKKKKVKTSNLLDKYITKTIKINKGNINYNSGNFKIPLFSPKNTKK